MKRRDEDAGSYSPYLKRTVRPDDAEATATHEAAHEDAAIVDAYLDHLAASYVRGVPDDDAGRAALIADHAHLMTEARRWWATQPRKDET